MRTTIIIAQNLNTNPFEVFAQDIDEVILLINYYTRLGENSAEANTPKAKTNSKEKRIRVNDKTASGGWF